MRRSGQLVQHAGRRNRAMMRPHRVTETNRGRLLLTVDGAEPEQQGCDQQASLGHYPGISGSSPALLPCQPPAPPAR